MAEKVNLKSVTYNLYYGFSQGTSYLENLCNDYDIIFMQERWLAPFDLDALNSTYVVAVVVEMNIIKVALSHFCCRTTVQSDSVSVARQVTVRRW